MSFKFLNLFTLVLVLVFLFFPLVVSAVNYLPLVPCGISQENESAFKAKGQGQADWNYSRPCTKCDTFRLVDNSIKFALFGVVPPVAAVLFIAAGLMILLAGANPGLYARGTDLFKNTFYGLVIILASWLIVNTFIQSFGPDQVKDSWFSFTCKEGVITPGGPPPIALCSNPAGLAAQYDTAFPYNQNAPELNALLSCVNLRLGQFIDQSQIYTYERGNELCNYTRGNEVCGNCAHRVNSCHYGGPNGSTGALAVDFNAIGVSEQELFNRLKAIENVCGFGFILFEDSHTHVSTPSCLGDTGGD
ncbi:MAG: hypothetical protein HYS78_01085 [Parcubacteria group bacterium]|nr:hypothetical protein [Parcubacteria group bacterium]